MGENEAIKPLQIECNIHICYAAFWASILYLVLCRGRWKFMIYKTVRLHSVSMGPVKEIQHVSFVLWTCTYFFPCNVRPAKMKLIVWKRECWRGKKENDFNRTSETQQERTREQDLVHFCVIWRRREALRSNCPKSLRYLGFRSVSADNLLDDLGQANFFIPHLPFSQFVFPYPFKLEALRMGFGS